MHDIVACDLGIFFFACTFYISRPRFLESLGHHSTTQHLHHRFLSLSYHQKALHSSRCMAWRLSVFNSRLGICCCTTPVWLAALRLYYARFQMCLQHSHFHDSRDLIRCCKLVAHDSMRKSHLILTTHGSELNAFHHTTACALLRRI